MEYEAVLSEAAAVPPKTLSHTSPTPVPQGKSGFLIVQSGRKLFANNANHSMARYSVQDRRTSCEKMNTDCSTNPRDTNKLSRPLLIMMPSAIDQKRVMRAMDQRQPLLRSTPFNTRMSRPCFNSSDNLLTSSSHSRPSHLLTRHLGNTLFPCEPLIP